MNKNRFTIKQMAKAIEGSGGIITDIAERLGCTRQSVYNYLNRYPKLKAAFDEEREILGDLCERAAIKLIKEGHAATVHLYLKTRYKNRGFADKSENDKPDAVTINVNRRIYE